MKFDEMVNKNILGDCYKLIKDIPDKSIDCVYIDVPYVYSTGGAGNSELAKRAAKKKIELLGKKKMFSKEKTKKENYRIAMNKQRSGVDYSDLTNGFDYILCIKEFFRIMKKPNLFIWCSIRQIPLLLNEIKKYNDKTIEILTWCKTNPIPTTNNLWLSDIEYCIYLRDGVRLNDGYELKSKFYISPINKADKDLYHHPTIKPLELVRKHLEHATLVGDIILDCFSGSGTTCVAAKELERNFIGIEVNPEYHKIAIDRLNGITANGQTSIFTNFDELEEAK